MGLLDGFWQRIGATGEGATPEPAACSHGALVPQWAAGADAEQAEKITGYRCDYCGREFSLEEAHASRASIAERLDSLREPPSPSSAALPPATEPREVQAPGEPSEQSPGLLGIAEGLGALVQGVGDLLNVISDC